MAERPTGKITDEGVARLRERIGVPEPWPLPPHYKHAERRRVPARRRGLRRRQPALVRSRLRREDRLGRADRVTGDGRRRHAHRRGRSHRGSRRQARPHEGRPAPRRARVLLRECSRVVGAAAPRPSRLPAQRRGGGARQGERVRRPRDPRVERERVPGRRRHDPVRPVPPDDPHRTREVRRRRASTKTSSSAATPTRRSTRSTRSTRRRPSRAAAPSLASGKTSRSATRSGPW